MTETGIRPLSATWCPFSRAHSRIAALRKMWLRGLRIGRLPLPTVILDAIVRTGFRGTSLDAIVSHPRDAPSVRDGRLDRAGRGQPPTNSAQPRTTRSRTGIETGPISYRSHTPEPAPPTARAQAIGTSAWLAS